MEELDLPVGFEVVELPANKIAYILGQKALHDFGQGGDVSALNQSILNFEKSLALVHHDDPNRHHHACALSEALRIRYYEDANEDDLSRAFELSREALSAVSPGHSRYITYSWHRSRLLIAKFELSGAEDDLHDAAIYASEALENTEDDDPSLADRLHTLSTVLFQKYQRHQDLKDLERALELSMQAVSCAQVKESARRTAHMATSNYFLNHLGVLFQHRFKRTRDIADLDQSITCGEKTLTGIDCHNPAYLGNLGDFLVLRYETTEDSRDLERAIRLLRKGLETCNNTQKASILSSLGIALSFRYRTTADASDIDSAIQALDEAINLCPVTHVNKAIYLNARAMLYAYASQGDLITSAFEDRSKILIETDNFEDDGADDETCRAFEDAFRHVESAPHVRLLAGENAIFSNILRVHKVLRNASIQDMGLLGEAISQAYAPIKTLCEQAIALLSMLSPRTLSRDSQQYKLGRLASLPAVAAVVCLRADSDAEKAWELLELGSSVMSSLAMDSKSDVTQLTETPPALANCDCGLRGEVYQAIPGSIKDNLISDTPFNQANSTHSITNRQSVEQSLGEFEVAVRSSTGFDSSQLPFSSEVAAQMAAEGPIVAIVVHEISGSAALIAEQEGVSFLPLPNLCMKDVKLNVNLVLGRGAERLTSGGLRTKRKRNTGLLRILRWLWEVAVQPILERLGLLVQQNCHEHKPLMWWHSSGLVGQLPLHAAGIYESGSTENAINYVYSSYTPTLKALRHARARQAACATANKPEALIVAMPQTPDGRSKDLSVNPEIRAIRGAIGTKFPIKTRIKPSCQDVLSRLESASVAHFACHGVSDPMDPSASRLKLYDSATKRVEPLSIRDISHLSYDRAQLAYLSACSTAKNSVLELSFESIHIVNAFQLLGFPHVIGTMWQANDDAAALVAGSFYKELFAEDDYADKFVLQLTSQNVVRALYKAVRHLQAEDVEDVLTWVPFVHFGA